MNSLWIDNLEKINSSGKLENNINTDVCIIGAGIAGITTAYYLTKKGFKTVVIERNEIGHGVTGHTTAKITSQHNLIYHYLSKQYGIEFAKKYFEANEKAIKNIEEIIKENNIDCNFERKDNCIYTINEENVGKIEEKAESLKHININAEKVENSGAIIDIDGTKVGVYKNEEGKIYYIKPVRTHLGCILEWNDADKTWDCPCHGSRYDKYGKNIYNPAIKDLEITK